MKIWFYQSSSKKVELPPWKIFHDGNSAFIYLFDMYNQFSMFHLPSEAPQQFL